MKPFSIKQRIRSFGYAIKGIAVFLATQHNAWLHLAATLIVLLAGWWLNLTIYEWIAVSFSIGFVFCAEIFNTAIEFLVDFISPEFNKKAGLIKDMAAAAVLVAAFTAMIIGVLIFVPKII